MSVRVDPDFPVKKNNPAVFVYSSGGVLVVEAREQGATQTRRRNLKLTEGSVQTVATTRRGGRRAGL